MTLLKLVVRLGFLLGLCLTGVAVGLARLAPSPDERTPRPLRRARAELLGINDYLASGSEHSCRLLDPETGRIVSMNLPGNDRLLLARSSPWEDQDGRLQVVGRWLSCNADGADGGVREVGVVRCTFPGGEVLDRVALDVVPASPPCWFPGPSPRILYGGTNGQLYQVAFREEADDVHEGAERHLHPEPLSWRCEKPGQGEVRISDPMWPTDPGLGGRLVACVSYVDRIRDVVTFVPTQVWWLQLSEDGRAIVAAGRLTAQRPRTSTPVQERMPTLAATPDRGLVLAYLSRPEGQAGWDLRLASVAIDAETGHPRARMKTSVRLARDVAVTPPSFSSDGRAVHGLRSPARSVARADRFPVADALPARDPRHVAWRADPARGPSRRSPSLEPLRSTRGDRFPSKS